MKHTPPPESWFISSYETFNKVSVSLNSNSFINNTNGLDGPWKLENSLKHMNANKLFKGPEFDYVLNENGFRSKSFSDFDKDKQNILFLGCSHTFGTGLPINQTWPKKLTDKISSMSSKDFDYYNLGIPGSSVILMFRNLISFIENVGKPNYVFMLLPETSRGLYWNGSDYRNVSYYTYSEEKAEMTQKYKDSYIHENVLLHETTMLYLLEQLCMMSGIKLVWSSWVTSSYEFYESLNFKNFIKLEKDIDKKYLTLPEIYTRFGMDKAKYEYEYDYLLNKMNKQNINNEPYWTIASDGDHFGSWYHETVASCFLERVRYEID